MTPQVPREKKIKKRFSRITIERVLTDGDGHITSIDIHDERFGDAIFLIKRGSHEYWDFLSLHDQRLIEWVCGVIEEIEIGHDSNWPDHIYTNDPIEIGMKKMKSEIIKALTALKNNHENN